MRLVACYPSKEHNPNNIRGSTDKIEIKSIPEDYMLDPNKIQRLEALIMELECNTPTNSNPNPDACSLDCIYEEFCMILDSQLEVKQVSCKGRVRNRNVGKEWWNEELGALVKEVRKVLRLWEANKSNVQLKSDYLGKQKEFSKTVRRYKRKYRRDRSNRLLQEQKKTLRSFGIFIKKLSGEDEGNLPEKVTNADGECVSEPRAVREEWMEYFQKLLNPTVIADQMIQDASRQARMCDADPEELNKEITVEEVKAAIYVNSDNKSPGVDGIKPPFIKNEACVKFIHVLCNHCFRTGTVPDAWLRAIIKPILKGSKELTVPSEYRGISLQSFEAKSYCRILNNRLREYLENNDTLSDEQNGFRPNRCCQDHILTLTSIVEC